jgi:Glycosyl hydrolases family 16
VFGVTLKPSFLEKVSNAAAEKRESRHFLFMNNKILCIFALFVLLNTYSKAQNNNADRFSSEIVTMLTNYNGAPNPEVKTGWNLIFKESFDGSTINTNKWSITGRNDDYPHLLDGNAWATPSNTSVSGGVCHLKLTNQPAWSQGNAYKPYSAAEIKTFTENKDIIAPFLANGTYWFDDFHYGFGVDTYIEMRVKVPGGRGAGSAGWLWRTSWDAGGDPKYREYDIWETYGSFKPKQFANTYIYGTPGYDGVSFSIKNIETANGAYIDADWYVFGIERTALGYKSYINGQVVRDLKFTDVPPCDIFSTKCPTPYPSSSENMEDMSLRLSSAQALNGNIGGKPLGIPGGVIDCNSAFPNQTNHLECDGNFNKELLVDYVRVYQKANTNAVKIKTISKSYLCTNDIWDYAIVSYSWYPDAVYTWTYPNALTKSQWNRNRVAFGFNQTLTPVANQTYPITLTATFPNGYVETKNFTISTNAPTSVSPTMITPQATRTGVQCFYRLGLSGTPPVGTVITSVPPVGQMLDENSTYQVQICATALCGGSSCVTKTLNTGSLTGCRGWVRTANSGIEDNSAIINVDDENLLNKPLNDGITAQSDLIESETNQLRKSTENIETLKKNTYNHLPLFYPNPIQQGEALVFNTHDLPKEECVIVVNDVLGKITQQFTVFKHQKAFIMTDDLSTGMHFVSVYDNNGQYFYTQKLIIQ